jgi:Protein of unknown function (DUF1579)
VRGLETTTPDRRLHAIAGRWETCGYVMGDPKIPVVGTDDYEVLAGGYFVVHRVDVTVGDQPVRAIEIIGEPDPESGGYLARSFDSDGNAELMHVNIDENGVFRFAGGADIAPAARPTDTATEKVRATLTIADDRRSMTARWERSEDGTDWQPWMDISFTRRD